ncbi:MAG: FkbM family methyltransferase [Acidimicrobiales bacterium]
MGLTKTLERTIDSKAPSLSVRLRLARKRWRRDATLALLRQLVSPGHAVVDIGAYRGVYTVALARLVAPGGRVLAIEPMPANQEALAVVARRHANVTVFAGAASDHSGTANLQIPLHQGHRLGALASMGRHSVASESVSVETATVDQLLGDCVGADQTVGFIRCDVVGHEDAALAGADRTLRSWRPAVLVEIEERHREQPVQVTLDRLSGYGYDGYFLRGTQLLALADFDVARDQRAFVDASFVPYGMPPDYVHYFLFVPPGRPLQLPRPVAGSGPNWLPNRWRRLAARKPPVAYHTR